MVSHVDACLQIPAMVASLPSKVTYSRCIPSLSIDTPIFLEGRSLICPMVDMITKFLSRNFEIVLIFAGDSTMINFFMPYLFLGLVNNYYIYHTTSCLLSFFFIL